MHLLCLPIKPKSSLSALLQVRKCPGEIDAVEIWLDSLKPSDRSRIKVATLIRGLSRMKPILAVCKNPLEKGSFTGSDAQKVDLLIAAAKAGAQWIDVGLHTKKSQILRLSKGTKCSNNNPSCQGGGASLREAGEVKTRLIISHHDFKKTPSASQLKTLVKKIQILMPSVVKIATMVRTAEDNKRLITLAEHLKSKKQQHIIIGMGRLGAVTRVKSRQLGNCMSFVSTGKKTAPGQLSIKQTKLLVPSS